MDLGRRQVHLWLCRPEAIVAPERLAHYRRLLSDADRARLGRLQLSRDRHTFLVTRALVRTTLSRYAPVAPSDWVFRDNRYGRPEIAGPAATRLRFNLSHARGLSVCAVADDREIGVDVERVSARATVEIAEDFFAPAEIRALKALPAHEQRDRFFALWTLKESYIKARGMGLALELDRFHFDLDSGDGVRIGIDEALDDSAETWQFERRRPSPAHHLAVAIRRGTDPPLSLAERYTTPPAGDVEPSSNRPAAP